MQMLLAVLPLVLLAGLMIGPRWSAQRAGPVSWLAGLVIAALWFGLTPAVLWVSQARGALLALYVLAVFWPALLLYFVVEQAGGIQAIVAALAARIPQRGLLLITLAWAFSAFLEGLAGFGIPIAVIAPILVSMQIAPITAVAAVAVGHAWSVTFGDMGVIFATLVSVSQMEEALLVGPAALAVGLACLLCGLSAAWILRQIGQWPAVLFIGVIMAVVQYAVAGAGLVPLAGMTAGLAGLAAALLLARLSGGQAPVETTAPASPPLRRRRLAAALLTYGLLAGLMTVLAWPGALHNALMGMAWRQQFPAVSTSTGFLTAAGPGQVFRPLLHPGTALLLAALTSAWFYRRAGLLRAGDFALVLRRALRSAGPASLGILAAVQLAMLMEHTGMTQLLAQGCASALGGLFPLVSPWIGMLGAFATGSNNNANVLFAPLQKTVALLIDASPAVLLAAQTAGGALGSMIAPAKLAVGCSTTGQSGQEGAVLRQTIVFGLGIALVIGVVALAAAR